MRAVLFSSNKGDINAILAFKNNFEATGAPGATDDAADGYEVGSVWINVSTDNAYICTDATEGAAAWTLMGESGIDPAELALLNGASAGVAVASKAASYDAALLLPVTTAALVALGTNQATSAPTVAQASAVTGADGTVGVSLGIGAALNKPIYILNTSAASILPVFPVIGGNDAINGAGANAAVNLAPGQGAWFIPTSATQWYVRGSALTFGAVGVAAGYKVARGTHVQVAAADTIVTGLTTVVAVVVSFKSSPTVKQLFCKGDIGNQSGAPAAGSFILSTFKPTAVNDVTPTAATDFTDNLSFDWVAIGT